MSQLHTNLCKTHKQNTHVPHSYTHRTVKHPRPEALSTQEVIHIGKTRSAQGLIHSTQAVDAHRTGIQWGNVQASVISLYPSVCHSVSLSVTHTHIDSYNTTHTQIYLMSLMVTQTLTHWHTCPTREVSGLLLSYTCDLSSNTFCFILLPESSLSVQKTQGPMKRENLGGLRICTDSHGGSPASKWCTRGSVFLHPKETPEGIFSSHQLEKQSTKATAQLLPGPLGRLLFRVHRGWAEPGFTGRESPRYEWYLGLQVESLMRSRSSPISRGCHAYSFSQGWCMVQAG